MSRIIVLIACGALLCGAAALRGDESAGHEPGSLKARPFDLKQVKLLEGPFNDAMQRDRKYLHELDSDRLLHSFRVNAGLPSSAEPLGGWERPDCEVRGHTVGHYLSACALMYASTRDEKLRDKADRIVAELAKCQKALGENGYLSAYPETFIDRVEAFERVWAPYYVLHKLYAGLLDVHVHCGNQQAMMILDGMLQWLASRTAELDEGHMQQMLDRTEQGGMNHVLADIHALTGNPDHLALARRFNQNGYIEPLAQGEDKLKGQHVNSFIPNMIGTARQYEVGGLEQDRRIAEFFWNQVVSARSYCTGGTSNHEHWRTEPNELAGELGDTTQETCCTYNMLKLTRHLFCWEPKPQYGDYYERALLNSILSTQNPRTGMMMYFVVLGSGRWKMFNTPNDSFWCCTGTGLENHAKYGDSIYFQDDRGLYVNLFIASELDWKQKNVRIRQETNFPEQEGTSLVVGTRQPVDFVLKIRVPYWATGGVTARLNGKQLQGDAKPSSYLAISNTWRDGDRVEIEMPMSLHSHPMPDDPTLTALMYGPLVLAGQLGGEGLTDENTHTTENWYKFANPAKAPYFLAGVEDLDAWIKPVPGKPLTFRTEGAGQPHDVTLVPYHKLFDQRYAVYWSVFRHGSPEHQAMLAREEARKRRAARIVDQVEIGDEASESDHGLEHENSQSGRYGDRHWRHARDGWFSYELAVLPDEPVVLGCTYWGDDVGSRTFDILVDDKKIATQTVLKNRPGKLFDVEYRIPPELTREKQRVSVRFQAHPDNTAGGLFGCVILRAAEYPHQPVPFTNVKFDDTFWKPRMETNRAVTIPYAFKQCEENGRMDNFKIAGGLIEGQHRGSYPFDDTDPYKIAEGASYALMLQGDPELEKYLDDLIDLIAAAQEDDGYLYTCRTNGAEHLRNWMGDARWSKLAGSHELYNAGHMYEAAVAHFLATGKRSFLDVAVKNADLIAETFGPGRLQLPPGHQVIEMGLVKLYRATGDDKYLRLAKFLLDVRGQPLDGRKPWGLYNQDHLPVVEQDEAVGHAVRASYMYAGMADIAALTGDEEYLVAIDRIWNDVVSKKLYVTGGIGATGHGEAFGKAHELPNASAYCETCAAIGNVYWNHRLFLLHGDAKYVDVLERTLYNGLISGVSLEGDTFFYPNPLASHGNHKRSPWFGCACCPGNVTRFMASIPGYAYAHRDEELYVNLFAEGTARVNMKPGAVEVIQETQYPWHGDVKITVAPEFSAEFALRLRIPGWARNQVLSGGLYSFAEENQEAVTLEVNGKACPLDLDRGYAVIRRAWKKGDVIRLSLPMPVRRVLCDQRVEANRGRVALQRGPLVYCAEWPDNNGNVFNLLLPDEACLEAEYKDDLLGGVVVVSTGALALQAEETGSVTQTQQQLVSIPYYAWAHRGSGEMAVWLAREQSAARPLPAPTIASRSTLSYSFMRDNGEGQLKPGAVNDQVEPEHSNDQSIPRFHWWPHLGTSEWIQLDFEQPRSVSSVEVYWFDDTDRGACRVPESWQLLYKKDDQWKPVSASGPFGVEKDQYNKTAFEPVTSDGLRIEVKLRAESSGGVLEWRVE